MANALICTKCNGVNRTIAIYCKHCGTSLIQLKTASNDLESKDEFVELIGLKNLKNEFSKILKIAQSMKKMGKLPGTQRLHTILMGNSGTGKNIIVQTLARAFHNSGITTKKTPLVINAVDYAQFANDLSNNYKTAKGGILFIDNVHKLVPAGYSGGQIMHIDKLFAEMEKNGTDPIVVIAGLTEGFRDYIDANNDVRNKFRFIFILPDLSSDEMTHIALQKLKINGFILDANAEDKIRKIMKHLVKTKDRSFGNGHAVNKLIDEIIENYYLRCDGKTEFNRVRLEDIKFNVPDEKTTEQILAELDLFVGMDNVKQYIKNIIDRVSVSKTDAEKTGNTYCFGEHMIITGNPGTGKTTLARKLGEVFSASGLLDRGHVIEVDRSKMVSQYVGQTPKFVQQLCDDALGGILFIDEAYTLKQDNNDIFGQQAIDTLLKRMEDDRGKFMVIAAGYSSEMQKFINANPGLKSRFKEGNIFNIDDYSPEQLIKIFEIFVKKDGYTLEENADTCVMKAIEFMYAKRDKNFGNGRDVRNFYEKCLELRAERIQSGSHHDMIIRKNDIPSSEPVEFQSGNPMMELDKLIGLASVKSEIKDLISYLEVEKMRASTSGTSLNYHFVFRGNPGTGKTTVARILGQVMKNIGFLSRGHVVEVDRKDLVAEYVGQTAKKTSEVFDSAIGGILFIDEAYTLVGSGNFDYGMEAINTILTRMENDRGKVIVIAAGYYKEMETFLASNPGLASRFTRFIDFEDYAPLELKQIFMTSCNSRGMKVSEEVEKEILDMFEKIYKNRDASFANGRTVRNVFEETLRRQARRLSDKKSTGADVSGDIFTIELADVSRGAK